MKTISIIVFLIISATTMAQQYKKENLKLDPVVSITYRYEKLQFYPVRANKTFEAEHKNLGKYTTLEQALREKKIVVKESDEVNKLILENTSKDTIMILAGEVVLGGNQDRMVGEDLVLHPKSGKKAVNVFCVEHGRWHAGQSGKSFDRYYTISSNKVRKAGAVNKNQSEVWNEVADKTSKNNGETKTGTLAGLKDSEDFNHELQKYVVHFEKLFVNEGDVIGIVAVSGEDILGCDMFASHELFKQHYRNLIHSYSTEAITSGKPVKMDYRKVNDYLDTILDTKNEAEQDQRIKEKGTLLKDRDKKLHISTF
jgi:hypothetical protein